MYVWSHARVSPPGGGRVAMRAVPETLPPLPSVFTYCSRRESLGWTCWHSISFWSCCVTGVRKHLHKTEMNHCTAASGAETTVPETDANTAFNPYTAVSNYSQQIVSQRKQCIAKHAWDDFFVVSQATALRKTSLHHLQLCCVAACDVMKIIGDIVFHDALVEKNWVRIAQQCRND